MSSVSNHEPTTTVRFYDSIFYTTALTSVTYLIFQIYAIRPHTNRLILFVTFFCICLGSETFFRIFQPTAFSHVDHLNITNYISPTTIHLILLLTLCSFLWNATQCSALASILLPTDNPQEQQSSFILRRWLRHVCVDHVFALLFVRLGRLTDVATVTALSDMASIMVLASWCSQMAVFPCMLCCIHTLFFDTTETIPVIYGQYSSAFDSVLHRLKIIKILGLALFSVKMSALSIFEALAVLFTTAICLSYVFVASPVREFSKYTRIFDLFIRKIPGSENEETKMTKKRVMFSSTTHNTESLLPLPPSDDTSSDSDLCEANAKSTLGVLYRRQSIISVVPPSSPTVTSSITKKSQHDHPVSASSTVNDYSNLTDEQLLTMIRSKQLLVYNLEKCLPLTRAVHLRRLLLTKHLLSLNENKNNSGSPLDTLPYEHYDYSLVINQCCENVLGYVQVPVGYVGPLLIDNKHFYIPMATTEGALVASTNRGCKAVTMSKTGIETVVFNDGMTRGPVLKFPTAREAHSAYEWFETNFDELKECFDRTSSFARLIHTKRNLSGRYLFVRFVATTGDAMGMNMVSKGVEAVLTIVKTKWPDTVDIISISGNYCVDKKPSALNWIDGRGKSVVAEAVILGDVLEQVLKTDANRLVQLNLSKNILGSITAGSIGGFNAHAANIVAAMFIACGQDPAQVVSSSNCLTWLEAVGPQKRHLYVSCTMYSLEVGTIGGGTKLPAQQACLKMLGVAGPSSEMPGDNSSQLARIICSTVLAGELSLLSALTTSDLVNSHLRLNRSVTTVEIK